MSPGAEKSAFMTKQEMGQTGPLQYACMVVEPRQSAPPWAGAGVLQAREWVVAPEPQVTEQGEVSAQGDQPPLTGIKNVQSKRERSSHG